MKSSGAENMNYRQTFTWTGMLCLKGVYIHQNSLKIENIQVTNHRRHNILLKLSCILIHKCTLGYEDQNWETALIPLDADSTSTK
jgi:hypothetical protein